MKILQNQGASGNKNEEDAMFSKKHVHPSACASSEKNLVNMYGQQVDYYAWKRLPFRDPNERLAKYGKGFSKMLSDVRSYSTTELPVSDVGNVGAGKSRNAYQTHLPNAGYSYDEMQHGPMKDHKTPMKVKQQFLKANNRERHHTSDSALPNLQNSIQ